MLALIAGLVIFLGVHSVRMVAPGWREATIARLGRGPWAGIYSLASVAGFVLMIWGYAKAQPLAPVVYVPPFAFVHLAILLMALAFVSFAIWLMPAGRLKRRLKHPMLLSVKIWALAHLLVNGDLASIVLFGTFLGWAVWNRIAVKRRGDAPAAAGPLANDVYAIVAGLAVWLLFIWKAHEWLIGVPVPLAA